MHLLKKKQFRDNNTTLFLFGLPCAVLTSRQQWAALQTVNAINNCVMYAQVTATMDPLLPTDGPPLVQAAYDNDLEASGQGPCQCVVCCYRGVYCIGFLWVHPHLDPHPNV